MTAENKGNDGDEVDLRQVLAENAKPVDDVPSLYTVNRDLAGAAATIETKENLHPEEEALQ